MGLFSNGIDGRCLRLCNLPHPTSFVAMNQTAAVQIVERVGGKYVLNADALARILQQKDVMNKKVAVLTVAGAFRKGKSFFLSHCVRFLQCKKDGRDWMSPAWPITGFTWRQSTRAVTEGILMWPEPFIVTNARGGEIAILLMDTEGAFDSGSTMTQCATVFALSALLSSVLVFNLMQDIQEDTLHHLQFFARYGSYALDEQGSDSPFQSLLFLVRDWQNANEYGLEAGRRLLEEKFKCRASSNASMKELRTDIQRSFVDIKCGLMPEPGSKIRTGSEGQITVNDMDPEFRKELTELVPTILDKLMCPKEASSLFNQIGGKQITGAEFLKFFKAYINVFGSDLVPEPKTIFEATAEATHRSAVEVSLEHYNCTMKTKFSLLADRQYFEEPALKVIHHETSADAVKKYTDAKKMGNFPQYLEELKRKIEEQFNDVFLKDNWNRIMIEWARKEKEEAERKRVEEAQRAREELAEKERERAKERERQRLEMEQSRKEVEEARLQMVNAQRKKDEAMRKWEEEKRRCERQEREETERRRRDEEERRNRDQDSVGKIQAEFMKMLKEERSCEAARHRRELECSPFNNPFQGGGMMMNPWGQLGMMQSPMTTPSMGMSSMGMCPQYDNFAPTYSNAQRQGTFSGKPRGRPPGSDLERLAQGIRPGAGTRGERKLKSLGLIE